MASIETKLDSLDSTTLAYIAGIVDGDGCITFDLGRQVSGHHMIRPLVTISNTNQKLIDFLLDKVGGSIHSRRKIENCKTVTDWCVSNQNAVRFVSAIRPWLLLKVEQAKLIDIWWSIHQETAWTRDPLVKQERDQIFANLKELSRVLNKRGDFQVGSEVVTKLSLIQLGDTNNYRSWALENSSIN